MGGILSAAKAEAGPLWKLQRRANAAAKAAAVKEKEEEEQQPEVWLGECWGGWQGAGG